MKHWSTYNGHAFTVKKKYDQTIYTFDIETTSYLILDGKIIPANEYLNLTDDEHDRLTAQATMYIWQFSINDDVYFGRTWEEFKKFIQLLEDNSPDKKIVFVHNLSFEFQFFCKEFNIKSVMARKSRKPISCRLADFNIEFRCSYYMSNVSLAYLPKLYNLPVEKQVGELDYTKLRHSNTELTPAEMKYCEYDCLVVYEYIKRELEEYPTIQRIPITSTGHVRRELQDEVMKDVKYRSHVRNSINVRPSVYNALTLAFAGGYTHANYMYADEVLNNVDSYDETSAYPYVMVTEKFPMSIFKPVDLKSADDMLDSFAYLIKVTFRNIKCKYYNNFISASKCLNMVGEVLDNGRVIAAREITIILTDVDFKFLLKAYSMESYEINEAYYAIYKHLPRKFIQFILKKYENKTKYKGVKGAEVFYAKEKAKFNALYGMTVTNTIRDEVEFKDSEWSEIELDNTQIYDKLLDEYDKGFLSFSWGVWVTAYARRNLLERVLDLDEYVVYCDTDSIKLVQGYDKSVFDKYNESVIEKIKTVSKSLGFSLDEYCPKDQKGRMHYLGIFECETDGDREYTYDKFITQGAKKYCVEKDGEIEITVSGVPKSGAKCVTKIEDFRDDLVFDYKYTNKQTLMYNDNQKPIDIIDCFGIKYKVRDKSGVALIPTTYKLGKAYEYAALLTNNSSKRSLFNENFN